MEWRPETQNYEVGKKNSICSIVRILGCISITSSSATFVSDDGSRIWPCRHHSRRSNFAPARDRHLAWPLRAPAAHRGHGPPEPRRPIIGCARATARPRPAMCRQTTPSGDSKTLSRATSRSGILISWENIKAEASNYSGVGTWVS